MQKKYSRSTSIGLRRANNAKPIDPETLELTSLSTIVADTSSNIDPIIVKLDEDISKCKHYLAIISKAKKAEKTIKARLKALEKSKVAISATEEPKIKTPAKTTDNLVFGSTFKPAPPPVESETTEPSIHIDEFSYNDDE